MTGCVYTQYSHALSRVAQRKRAGPITQRSVDRNHPLLRTHFSRILRFLFFTVENGACPGVEPGTSRTRSANHTTRPTGQCIHYINKGRKTWAIIIDFRYQYDQQRFMKPDIPNVVWTTWGTKTVDLTTISGFCTKSPKRNRWSFEYYFVLARTHDEVAEWLRRWTANPLVSPNVSSNLILVGYKFFI